MNRELMLLSDNNVAVTNDNGHISKRFYNSDNIKEILLFENKVEIIDNKLNKMNKELIEQLRVIKLSKGMLKFQWIILIISIIYGFFHGIISYPTDSIIYGLYYSLYYSLFALVYPISIVIVFFGAVKLRFNKKIKNTQFEISRAENLKEEYKKELMKSKEINSTYNKRFSLNIPISLTEETANIEKNIDKELYNTCIKMNTNKKLVKRK